MNPQRNRRSPAFGHSSSGPGLAKTEGIPNYNRGTAAVEGLSFRNAVQATHEPVANVFGDAEAYDRFMGRWSRLLAARFVDLTDLPEQGRILDIGSGTSSLASAI